MRRWVLFGGFHGCQRAEPPGYLLASRQKGCDLLQKANLVHSHVQDRSWALSFQRCAVSRWGASCLVCCDTFRGRSRNWPQGSVQPPLGVSSSKRDVNSTDLPPARSALTGPRRV